MELVEAVAALRAHAAVARVAEELCGRLAALSHSVGSEQAATEAGVIEAVVAAMRAHPQRASVQEYGCLALGNVCYGDEDDDEDIAGDAARARRQRATQAGGRAAIAAAMQAHPDCEEVQDYGRQVLNLLLD